MRYEKNKVLFSKEESLYIEGNKEEIDRLIGIIKEKFNAVKVKGI